MLCENFAILLLVPLLYVALPLYPIHLVLLPYCLTFFNFFVFTNRSTIIAWSNCWTFLYVDGILFCTFFMYAYNVSIARYKLYLQVFVISICFHQFPQFVSGKDTWVLLFGNEWNYFPSRCGYSIIFHGLEKASVFFCFRSSSLIFLMLFGASVLIPLFIIEYPSWILSLRNSTIIFSGCA